MTVQDKLADLKNALERLKEGLTVSQQSSTNLMLRDGAIQRFEFTFELAWKTLKEACETKGKSAGSPMDIFRLSADLYFVEDPKTWFDFLKNRNLASHLYDNAAISKVFSDIPKFIAETEKVIAAIEKQL